MPARLFLAAIVLAALVSPAETQAKVRFTHGVAAGEVRSTSAVLWGRSSGKTKMVLFVARDKRFKHGLRGFELKVRASHDFTFRRRVRRLKPGRRYWYVFFDGVHASKHGTFKTAPKPSANEVIDFAWTGDTDFAAAPGKSKPYWNGGGVFARMRAERNDFNVHLGDTIYSDSEVPGRLKPIALSVAQKWRKYKLNLGIAALRSLRGSAGFYSHWDDHEFVNDFSRKENSFETGTPAVTVQANGQQLYRRGVRAFRDYAPVKYSKQRGLYRSVRWGKNLELFFLDERSFRSAKAAAGGVCDNPQTHKPDLAPTAPQRIRNLFGVLVPSSGLSQPVSQACLNTIRSSSRAFLGQAQLNRFAEAIKGSSARWKVVMNELPIQQFYVLPYDRWEGYEFERASLLNFLRRNVKDVIFLTTDVHATLVNDARLQTLEPGGPVNSGIFDFTVGPAATANLGLEIDQALGRPGGGALADAGFLTPPPPGGVGMRCSVLNLFSYGQVHVTRNRLTVTPKGIDGQPLAGCPALVLNHS